ncbi:MAG: hypothetical protein OXG88_08055 [Gammaproteobacteria bacterium]|nr:hypothetical protein [Gammaproteobacteria bacterium]
MSDLDEVTDWQGEYTDATWLSDPEHNTYLSIDKNEYRFGHTSYTHPWDVVDAADVSIRFWVHPKNIGAEAILRNEAPFKHLMIYWMMHEFVHVLQAVHERDDGDNQFVPHASGSWEREMETHSILEKWWKARFGVDAPYRAPNKKKPRKWDKYAEEYDDLVAKKTKGENWTTKDEKRLKKLEEYFRDNYPEEVDNRGYDADEAELDCD